MEQIKAHFYGSHAEWNKYSVIPRGLGFMELLDLPHDRGQFANGPTEDELAIITDLDQDKGGFTTPLNADQYTPSGQSSNIHGDF